MTFGVDIPSYHGPLDLLLYLVRREELPLEEISLAKITRQYLDYLHVLQQLDLDDVGEFIEITSQLIEMKARVVLPENNIQEEESNADSSRDASMPQLIERLVQYKRFRDAASLLDEQSRRWQLRYSRMANDLPPRRVDPNEQPVAHVEIWDLVSAFGRILRSRQKTPQHQIQYDDTPIHVYMQRLHETVKLQDKVELQDLFQPGMHKSALVAMFLATLELTRHHGLLAVQPTAEGPLWLTRGPAFQEELAVAQVDSLRQELVENSNMPVRPR